MNRTIRDYLIGFIIAAAVFLVAVMAKNRIEQFRYQSLSRAIDTVNVGTTPNDGTGDPLRTAFLKINEAIKIMDSLDLELLTNDEVQALRAEMRDDAATIFPTIQYAAGDTSNYDTPDKIGDLYIDTSAGEIYVSIATTRGGWRILN